MKYVQKTITDTLAISEATGKRILCTDDSIKELYILIAEELHFKIPSPITIIEYLDCFDSIEYLDNIMLDNMDVLFDFIDKLYNRYCQEETKTKKKTITKFDALSLLGFNPEEYEIVD